ncbi:two pore channel protein 2-like [Mercenaria mercenaria]|uniref:two pore channel protein 2-like n=1 Tax=Mercenaria mercenaria TaxID=6596 RepID=UPI00234F1FC7|nr:two pore channel protein 2-like [Mercenaria mercenaria]
MKNSVKKNNSKFNTNIVKDVTFYHTEKENTSIYLHDLENETTGYKMTHKVVKETARGHRNMQGNGNTVKNNTATNNTDKCQRSDTVVQFETAQSHYDKDQVESNKPCRTNTIDEKNMTKCRPDRNSVVGDDLPTYLRTGSSKSGKGQKIGSESLITDNDLLLAATLVANAMEGKTFEVKREPRFVRSYNLYKSRLMCLLLYTAIFVTLMLAVFEKPSMPNFHAPYWITMAIESVCQLFFVLRIYHHKHWRVPKGFKKDLKMILAVTCTVITILDMCVYMLVVELTDFEAVRYSRLLRPLFIFFFSDSVHLKRAWSNIRMTLKQISHVIVLFYFLILVFALVAVKIFQERTEIKFPDGREYFKNYLESFWELYVLVTTANNPDVMMPAYEKNRWYCLFFTSYIILCLYLILNILLAVTYNSYRENMKVQIKYSSHMKKAVLNQAFEVIKINVDGNEMVTYKTWIRLINLAHPGITKHQADLLMMVLDTDKTGFISRKQFSNIADLLNVPISVVSERKNFMELHCKTLYNCRISSAIRNAVETTYFSLTYDAVVFVNVILIALNINEADWVFCSLYILEIALKWYTFGTKRFLYSLSNWSDLIITIISLAILIITEVQGSTKLSAFNVFRIFRVLRFLTDFERFRIIFDAVFNVSYSIMTYCIILFIVFYCFAILGMELFAGKIQHLDSSLEWAANCNNTALNGSVFVANDYCNVNFNDILNSVVLIASLLIVNNWHVICEGFALVTSKAARLYFMSFHLTIAVVIMNIVTAFILDMFMYEYTFSKKGHLDTKVEMTIKQLQLGIDDETGMEIKEEKSKKDDEIDHQGDSMSHTKHMIQKLAARQNAHTQVKPNLSRFDGIRFHMKKRDWTRTELLLQQLFELEEEIADADKDHQLISMLN